MPVGYAEQHPSWTAGPSTHMPQLPEPLGTLIVSGYITDDILRVGEPFTLESMSDIIARIMAWRALTGSQTQYSSSEAFDEVFCHTLIIDTNDDGQKSTVEDRARTEALIQHMKDIESPELTRTSLPLYLHDKTAIDMLNRVCFGRTIALTRKGYIGLAPMVAKSGDLICLLKGGPVPLVLRRLNDLQWTLGRHCYVDGITSGEAFQESQRVEMDLV